MLDKRTKKPTTTITETLLMFYVKGMRYFVLFFPSIRETYVIALFSLAIKISETVCIFQFEYFDNNRTFVEKLRK